jgi:asparagine synthase (glutamine-hydrolysing)
MCGIAGIWSKNSHNEELVRQMMDSIKHRGPDGEGLFSPEENLTFGHVRLAIIDIKQGHQPMQTSNEEYTIVFNGEIYNYIELRKALSQKGISLQTNSDTEVLLHMYQVYGEKMLQQLNGMFAFAIYSRKDNSVFIARDHFGIKPLYYFENDSIFAFASEIKALLKIPEIKSEIDEQSLNEYLTFQFVLKKHTLFKNILKLEPGTFLKLRKGKVIIKKRYWNIDFTVKDVKSEEQYAEELIALLETSMRLQMRSDVPVGAYLSGGLDSSAVTMLASKISSKPLSTFTGAFAESKDFDETEFAKIVANAANAKQHTTYPKHTDFIEHFEKIVYMMDEPAAGPGVFPQFMVSKLASSHVKVVLGGQAGDEIFGGYARYAVAYLEQCLKGAIFETQEEGQHIVTLSSIINNLPVLKQYVPLLKKQFKSGLFESMDRRYFQLIDRSPNLKNIYSKELLKSRNENSIFDKFSQIFNRPDTHSYFNKMTHFDMETLLPSLLHVEDRASMAFSIESRVPLLDKNIVELAAKIPSPMKFAGGKTKYMLIKALENIVPKSIIQRKDKMGFPVPLTQWFSGPLKDYCMDLLTDQTARNRGLLKTETIEKQINNEGKFSREIWGALNLEVWHRKFID